ncbi:hypothetical protein LOY67_19385 [Pseudomonas sp. B21-056]|jgi:hypothetical protein|uniref:hypothetical protein n=1 Tax=Pseudomonas sp. B21-056 TaxID=2895495 RepID=UPI0022303C5B|nr:hypothetical protein [Pseudomonas sp. B21-056]UZE22188.1 hypothetical protein LOY67_19385 [Pseudomonas sp. B21-056]
MSDQFDPQGRYEVIDPEGIKIGEINHGEYFEGGWHAGGIKDKQFYYDGALAGRVEGLTLVRLDPPGAPETRFTLVPTK